MFKFLPYFSVIDVLIDVALLVDQIEIIIWNVIIVSSEEYHKRWT